MTIHATVLCNTVPQSLDNLPESNLVTLKMEAASSSESSKHTFHLTWSNNPEDKHVSSEHVKIYKKSMTRLTTDFSKGVHLPSSVVLYLHLHLHDAFLD